MSAPQIQYPPTSGGGTPTGGSGTANTIPLWTGSTPSTTLTDSLLTQASTIITNSGTFRTADGSNTEPGYTFTGSSGSGMYRGSSGTILRFASSGAFAFGVSSSGNVLIGGTATTTPGGRLDVVGVAGLSWAVRAQVSSSNTAPNLNAELGYNLKNTSATVGNYTSITNRDSSDNANTQINFINVNNSGSGAINFVTRDSVGGSGERARIDSSGNVGIGETSPASYGRLAVTGSAVGAGILGMNTDATRVDIQSYNKPLAINRAGNNTLMNEGGGNVGIGTASPNAILSVYNAGTPTISLWNSSNYSRLATNTNDLYIDAGLGGAAGAVIFRRGSGTVDSARIESNGRFIVAGTGATESLQVNAGFRVGGAANVATQTSAGPAIISYEYPTTRHYVGDNSGYSWAVSRRVASATFDLISITDNVGSLFVPAADSYFYGVRVGRGAGSVSSNTAVGSGALGVNTTGLQNTALGFNALGAVASGQNNTGLGFGAMVVATGSNNTAVGAGASNNQTTGANNTSVGHQAGWACTTSSNNTSVGQNAALYQTGANNVAVGMSAMLGTLGSSTATNNVSVGTQAGQSVTTGGNNVFIGHVAGSGVTTSTNNTMIGYATASGGTTTGGDNTLVGAVAGNQITSGANNVCVGSNAGQTQTTANDNTYVGKNSGYFQTGSNNTALGRSSLLGTTGSSGAQNTAIGHGSLIALTSGSNNTALGLDAGNNITTGSSNICLGRAAATAAATDSNQLVVGSAAQYVATNGGATTYYATAGASLGYIQVRLNGANVKIQVFAP